MVWLEIVLTVSRVTATKPKALGEGPLEKILYPMFYFSLFFVCLASGGFTIYISSALEIILNKSLV